MRSVLIFPVIFIALPAASQGGDAPPSAEPGDFKTPTFSFDQLGAEAQKKYTGDGIGITPAADGAHLRAIMQDLEATATSQGLWLNSTADEDAGKSNRFSVKATAIRRSAAHSFAKTAPLAATSSPGIFAEARALPETGIVRATETHAVFVRPSLIEEYSVSTDGVRQDFVVLDRPRGEGGTLVVELEVTGAKAETAVYGVKLTLDSTGREMAYSRLKVTDATGRELEARIDALNANRLCVAVEDAQAAYPVRIDPTFSDADWVSMSSGVPGANGVVYTLVIDGSDNLYAGGSFTAIGTVLANRIAKWNGSAWSALGSGMYDTVYALAASGTDLYAAGGVNSASYIAKWNGSAWSALGGVTALNGYNQPTVRALAISGTDLFVGGYFTTVGGVSANSIAKWNGAAWSALGLGTPGGVVNALAVNGTDLYAGGMAYFGGGVNVRNIGKWNGNAWSALGSGIGDGFFGEVRALAVSGTDLYAGGNFSTAGGVSVNNIAKWNGSEWSELGSGVNFPVGALAVSGADIYAGGEDFFGLNLELGGYVAKWNGDSWSALVLIPGTVSALVVSGTELYVSGIFDSVGAVSANSIAKWNGSTWSALGSGSGITGIVSALAVSGTELYAGGSFTFAGGVRVNNIAKWNGSEWMALGSGTNQSVSALAVSGTDLYAGGRFTSAGGVSARRIAQWNGTTWSALGSGISHEELYPLPDLSFVNALAVSGTDLYAGGLFTTAGGVSASCIAKWNGTAWSSLGSGTGGAVNALVVSGLDLYAGGEFTTAGGVSAAKIAKWNGSSWSALGSGVEDTVFALAASGTDLYAGGGFNYVAKWNGNAWSALGGLNEAVYALAVSGTDLYAGGYFTLAGGWGATANRIAKWNGSAWSALGSGMDDRIQALAVIGTDLYAGGAFGSAGGKFSPYLARADISPEPIKNWRLIHFGSTVNSGDASNFFDLDKDGLVNLLEYALDLNPTVSNPGGLPLVTYEGGYLTMTITKQPGVNYEVQTAGSLISAEPDSFSSASTTVLINDAVTLKARDNFLISGNPRRFIRLKVAVTP